MFPPTPSTTSEQRKLSRLFASLDEQDRSSLLAFAEFLVQRRGSQPAEAESAAPEQPRAISRPDSESVVGAIKRLSKTYYMLQRSDMLDETSSLMTAHVMQGRSAKEVIDDLERVFAEHYRRYRARHSS